MVISSKSFRDFHIFCKFIYRLVNLAFAGSIGMTLVILACALPQYKYVQETLPIQTVSNVVLFQMIFIFCRLWWPCFVIIFYILSVIPTLLAKRSMQSSLSGTTPCFEFAIFLTMGFVVCSFALPIVLNRADVVILPVDFEPECKFTIFFFFSFQIKFGACILTLCGNVVVYVTILGYFLFLDPDENATYGGMAWLL